MPDPFYWKLIRSRLCGFGDLPQNWNGYNGAPPKPSAISQCLSFLDMAGNASVPFVPMVSGKGTVGLYWERGNDAVELEFFGDGKYGFLVISGDVATEEEGVPVGDFPDVLRAAISSQPLASQAC